MSEPSASPIKARRSFGGTEIPAEAQGPALSWQDRRAVEITKELAGAEDRLTEITGLPLDPYFAAPKMTWLRRRTGDGDVITTVDAWLNHRLDRRLRHRRGHRVSDDAARSRSCGLVRGSVRSVRHSTSRISPPCVDCDAVVGETDAFGPTLPVAGLVVDQQAALFAESCFGIGEAKCTYGTGAFILATAGEEAVRSRARLAACVAWKLGGRTTYCLDGQVYTAASVVTWLEQLGMIAEAAELDRLGPERDRGVIFVPALAGLAAPFWEPEARGAGSVSRWRPIARTSFGPSPGASRPRSPRLAHAIGDDLGRPLERLRVDGGLSRSSVLMQAQADLLQAPVERYPSADATALGAAALARLGVGAADTPAGAVGAWTPAATFEPAIEADRAEERLARWHRAAEAMADLARRRALIERVLDHDVVVVGAGVVGAAIARELSRFQLRCVVIEAKPDVGAGTSKANTALLHTGFDAKPGTLESRLVRRGYGLLRAYAAQVGIAYGADRRAARGLERRAAARVPRHRGRARAPTGTTGSHRSAVAELARREPHLGPGALGALEVPDEAIICPFTIPLAYATEAVLGGCELRLGDVGDRDRAARPRWVPSANEPR